VFSVSVTGALTHHKTAEHQAPIPLASRKALFCGRSLAEITVLNLAGCMDVLSFVNVVYCLV
jgi:malonyl CoA-acyl carrier protein transacylase